MANMYAFREACWTKEMSYSQFPAASRQLITKVLGQMKKAGKVKLTGKKRGAQWEATTDNQ